MKTLDTKELNQRLEAGPVALFDVRGDLEYEEGHIPGAKTAPLGSLVFRVASVMAPDSFIAVYDAGDGSGLAAEAAERLDQLRHHNVHVYEGGLSAWRAAGHPVIPSPHAKVHARGPVVDVRSPIVDRKRAYNGAFLGKPVDVDGAGG